MSTRDLFQAPHGDEAVGRWQSDAPERSSRVHDHPVATGAVAGLVWGVAIRGWMRFISTDPEFSWSGTMFILVASVVVGSLMGLARKRRRSGGVGWWRTSVFSLMLLGAGGAVMWPSVIAGAIAIGRPRPPWMRAVLGLAAVGSQVPILREVVDDLSRTSWVDAVFAIVWYVPLIASEAWAFSVVFAPPVSLAATPGRFKRILIALPLVAMTVMGAVVVGLPG